MADAHPNFWIRRIPVAMLAVPFLWALAIQICGSRPTPVAAPPKRAALAFSQRLVDLGKVAPTEQVMARFDFVNRGEEAVKILELVPSCGCLQPTMEKKLYYPGQKGHFVVRVKTANQSAGQKEYSVTVKYADPVPQQVDLVFKVHLPENQVFVTPPVLPIYQLGDEPKREKVEIIDRRGKSFNILSVDCTRSQLAHVELEEADVDENGHTRHRLWVEVPGNIPEDKVYAMVRVYTDDPDYRMLRVPFVIESRRPKVMAGKPSTTIRDPNVQTVGARDETPGR